MSDPRYEVGSGNVFADLGLPDADELSLKAELVWKIKELLDARGWKQAEAAGILGCTQAEVSDLHRCKISRFSTDRLIRLLKKLGHRVSVNIFPEGAAEVESGVEAAVA